MMRSKRLEPVRRLAVERTDRAAVELAAQRREVEQLQERKAQLESFRDEYRDQLRQSAERGIDPFRLLDYRAFLARIDAAIVEQEQTIHQGFEAVDRQQTEWITLRGRSVALGNVVERLQHDERRHAERLEQNLNDELGRRRVRPRLGERD